jgi:hypothetical protein
VYIVKELLERFESDANDFVYSAKVVNETVQDVDCD